MREGMRSSWVKSEDGGRVVVDDVDDDDDDEKATTTPLTNTYMKQHHLRVQFEARTQQVSERPGAAVWGRRRRIGSSSSSL